MANAPEKLRLGFVVALAIGAAHLVTHAQLYAGNAGFPDDFLLSYFSMVAFGTTAAGYGILPEWMPFQSMGYPFLLNPQTGFFYPPFQLFSLLGVQYSFRAATWVQLLHVAFAAMGAYLLARTQTRRWQTALFAALAFHFFGGFYSNAEHPDIVRAFAWLPWLFWSVTPDLSQRRWAWRNLLAPLVVVCVITGSYPGNFVSHLFLLGIYGLVLFIREKDGKTRWLLSGIFAGVALGVVLAAPVLLPTWSSRSEFFARNVGGWVRIDWDVRNWLTLILPWSADGFVDDPSMRSAFVGVPVMCLLVLWPPGDWRSRLPWLVIAGMCLALLPGAASPIYVALGRAIPPLGLSRYASSDYRGLFALALILLSAQALDLFLDLPSSQRRDLVRSRTPVLALLALIVVSGHWQVAASDNLTRITLAVFVAVCGLLWMPEKWKEKFAGATALAFGLLAVLHALPVVRASQRNWFLRNAAAVQQELSGIDTHKPYAVNRFLETPPSDRPARGRVVKGTLVSAWGYLNATYEMSDIGGFVLGSRRAIESDPQLYSWMADPWNARVLPGGDTQPPACDSLKSDLAAGAPGAQVRLMRYGLSSNEYQVTLDAPSWVVENEIYFPGWSAQPASIGSLRIEAKAVCGGLRAWRLPAGEYRMTSTFRTPRLRASFWVAGVGLLGYLTGIVVLANRRISGRARLASALQAHGSGS